MFSLWSLVDKTQIWLKNVEAVLHCDRQKSVGKSYHQWNGHSVSLYTVLRMAPAFINQQGYYTSSSSGKAKAKGPNIWK